MPDEFVRSLCREGRMLVGAEPSWQPSDEAVRFLKQAFADVALQLSGPPLQPDLDTLVAATSVTYRCGWLLLHHEVNAGEDDPSLRMPRPPGRPAEHLSADVVFRFLPGLYHRVKARPSQEDLYQALGRLLRGWPLSGVLAEVPEPPETPLDFDGHRGLRMLYAERLAQCERPGWFPDDAAEVELVWQALGRNTAVRLHGKGERSDG